MSKGAIKTQKNQIDMLNGPLFGKLLAMAIPLALSSILQQLFNSVDVAVVGKFASSQAQAAVGCNGSVINLFLNLFVGISVGANVIVANYIGQEKFKQVKNAVHTSMLVAILSGLFLIVLGLFAAQPIMIWMNTPEDVLSHAVLYLRIYFVGMPFILVYNFGAAILRSVGDTRRPLYCLVISGVINAVLNMILVIVFHMGVAGVGIATVISNVISAAMVWYYLAHEESAIRLNTKELMIDKGELKKMLQIGIPAGLQGMVFSISNVYIQAAVNGYGSAAVAGSAVMLNYESFAYFIVAAFNQTVVTFTSQNYGAGKYKRCNSVYRISMLCSVVMMGAVSGMIILNSDFFISLFTSDPAVVEFAKMRMYRIQAFNFMVCSYEISGSALRGIGYSLTPALLTVFGVCILRFIWVALICPILPGFMWLLSIYPISWLITGPAVLIAYYILRRKAYAGKAVA